MTIAIKLSRDIEDEEELKLFAAPVTAPFYPKQKEEQWWAIIGQGGTKLLAIKKVTLRGKETSAKLTFLIDDAVAG